MRPDVPTNNRRATDEMKLRGKAPPSGSGALPRNAPAKPTPKEGKLSKHRRESTAEAALPSGKVNAVRAAFSWPTRLAHEGWLEQAAEVSAQTSDSANSLPMFDIPRLVGQPGGLEEQHKMTSTSVAAL